MTDAFDVPIGDVPIGDVPVADVPVALFIFNRPAHVARVMEAIARARPARLLVVADGPRADHPDDGGLCRAARDVATQVDWPCAIETHWSDLNLGCDERLLSGLDWVFSRVERAIILEDDVVPHHSFFAWCAALLDRYANDPEVLMVSGRNDLGSWGSPDADHLLVRRGSIYGWATWADSWAAVDCSLPDAADPATRVRLEQLDLDPLLREHISIFVELAAQSVLAAWDCRYLAAQVLRNGWAVMSPVNLVANIGFGAGATRTMHEDELVAGLTSGAARPVDRRGPRPQPDPDFDHMSVLVTLMSAYRQPQMAFRLARSRRLLLAPDGSPDLRMLHHLAPVDHLEESVAVLAHLREVGLRSDALDRLQSAFVRAASTSTSTSTSRRS